jgi:hypothetical protein
MGVQVPPSAPEFCPTFAASLLPAGTKLMEQCLQTKCLQLKVASRCSQVFER